MLTVGAPHLFGPFGLGLLHKCPFGQWIGFDPFNPEPFSVLDWLGTEGPVVFTPTEN